MFITTPGREGLPDHLCQVIIFYVKFSIKNNSLQARCKQDLSYCMLRIVLWAKRQREGGEGELKALNHPDLISVADQERLLIWTAQLSLLIPHHLL